jgi:erythrocyte band 7 integral membrane protein
MFTLTNILSDSERIANSVQQILDEATESWGIKVERVELKDVRLPAELQRAMAAEAEATRDARARMIIADGEVRAARALRAAADGMQSDRNAMLLRYFHALTAVAAKNNMTIVMPISFTNE